MAEKGTCEGGSTLTRVGIGSQGLFTTVVLVTIKIIIYSATVLDLVTIVSLATMVTIIILITLVAVVRVTIGALVKLVTFISSTCLHCLPWLTYLA
jgi:hypothetical protein